MAKIIAFPGAAGRGPVREAEPDPADDVWEASRWWRLGRDILRCAAAGSGLRQGRGGALPPDLARQLALAHIRPFQAGPDRAAAGGGADGEADLVLGLLEKLSLLKAKKGYWAVSRAGSEAAGDPARLYPLLFDLAMTGLVWEGERGGLWQELAPRALGLLARMGEGWVSAGALMDAAAAENPAVAAAPEPWYETTLRRYFEPLGLVELRCLRADLRAWTPRDEEVAATDLFRAFLPTGGDR